MDENEIKQFRAQLNRLQSSAYKLEQNLSNLIRQLDKKNLNKNDK